MKNKKTIKYSSILLGLYFFSILNIANADTWDITYSAPIQVINGNTIRESGDGNVTLSLDKLSYKQGEKAYASFSFNNSYYGITSSGGRGSATTYGNINLGSYNFMFARDHISGGSTIDYLKMNLNFYPLSNIKASNKVVNTVSSGCGSRGCSSVSTTDYGSTNIFTSPTWQNSFIIPTNASVGDYLFGLDLTPYPWGQGNSCSDYWCSIKLITKNIYTQFTVEKNNTPSQSPSIFVK